MCGSKIKGLDMKRLLSYITLTYVPFMFFSCVEEFDQTYEEQKFEKIFYTSVADDSLMTKTMIGMDPVSGQQQLHWLQEDCIGVSTGNKTVEKFVNISTETGKSAIFKGNIATSSVYYAVYPYTEGMTMPSKKFTVDVPAVQPYEPDTFASGVCPMAGKSDEDSKIYFNNLCGVLVINLTGTDKITTVSFQGMDASGALMKISGEHTVDMSYTDVPALASTSNSSMQVTLKCDTPVELDSATPTAFHFVLPPAEYNSFRLLISTDDGRVMIKEGRKPLTIKRANITTAGALEFVETIDIDLSAQGNSNCYVVSEPGLYSFDATTIGNGEFGLITGAGFHTDDPSITPVSAEILWSYPESVISDANYDSEEGKINFYASGIEGNALIAAKDADGTILWSWHIWATDQPQDHHYVNNIGGEFDVQDRNLGATRADRGTGDEYKESCGLDFCWGRKDPFMGKKHIQGHYSYSVAESVLYPNQKDLQWRWGPSDKLWSTSSKTIYDPCPSGYRVAPTAIWKDFSTQKTSGTFDHGWNFFYDEINTAWYPNRSEHSDSGINYWNDSYMVAANRGLGIYFSSGSFHESGVDYGSLRCMKDINTPSFSLEYLETSSITTTSVSAKGRISISGNPYVTRRGFVYGYSSDVSLENGVIVDVEGGEGEFSASIDGLSEGTKYFVRVFAITSDNTLYSPASSFITPNSAGVIDLSAYGTSNSYIISQSGTYSFNATVKGNSTESVGESYYVDVLWETWNTTDAVTKNSVIASVELDGDYVKFSTPETFTPGNALIVVKNITGKIIWSWHIWAVDFDPEGYAQLYPSGAMMMDRNLGALVDDIGDVRSFGLYYQWGRKDPFVGRGEISGSTFASTSPENAITYVDRDSSTDQIDYVTRYPSRVVKNSTWNNADGYWADIKTQYDPCPPGWRVPERDAWSQFESSQSFKYKYPDAGYVHNAGLNTGVHNWTLNRRNYWNGSSTDRTRDVYSELPVRCMKDAVFTISNNAEADVISDVYVTVSGNLTVSDATVIESKGFICSTSSDPKLNIEGCIITEGDTSQGDFTLTVKDLKPGTTYYIRAYAKGGYNVRYGNVITLKTKEGADGEGYLEDDEIFEW